MGGPVFYKQIRIGKDLKPFKIYKFRSMKTNRKELDSNLTHDEMVTKVGKFIRRTSIDELPQIINILKGEMAFIGPRPWIEEYYKWFDDNQKRRSEVLPGLSGLAQVMGRNGLSINDKIKYDVEYVDTMNFKLDLKIWHETLKTIFCGQEAEISENGIKDEIEELKQNRIAKKKPIKVSA
ncbi:MAG: sugar transferase [Clostridia bacterium]|nr:sugar transferase [Clostridia bacterium]